MRKSEFFTTCDQSPNPDDLTIATLTPIALMHKNGCSRVVLTCRGADGKMREAVLYDPVPASQGLARLDRSAKLDEAERRYGRWLEEWRAGRLKGGGV